MTDTIERVPGSLTLTILEKRKFFAQICASAAADTSSLCAQIKLAAALGEREWVDQAAIKLVEVYKGSSSTDAEKGDILVSLVLCGCTDIFSQLISEKYSVGFAVLTSIEHYQGPIDSVCFQVDSYDKCQLIFNVGILGLPWREIALIRVLFLLPIFFRYMLDRRSIGKSYVFQLGDASGDSVYGFCSNAAAPLLIPDASFLQNLGYIHWHQLFMEKSTPWNCRKPVVFWRGQTTGEARSWLDLDRVQLCLAAQESKYSKSMDVALSGITQRSEFEVAEIEARGLVGDFVPMDMMDEYQYHIDIDGNTNSWPGLYLKLLSGSPVLKIQSRLNYRQWYYHRLIPWHNYVPIKADLSDLDAAIERLMGNATEAEQIGKRGAQLAYDMTYERELVYTVTLMEEAAGL